VFPFKISPFLRTFLLLLVLSIVLVVLSPSWSAGASHVILWPYTWLQRGILRTAHAAEERVQDAAWDEGDAAELKALRRRVVELEAQVQREIHQRQDAESRLRQLTTLPAETRTRSVLAQLAGFAPSPLQRCAIFDKGASSDVAPGRPVFWYGAVLGRVETAGPATCTVRLLTDPKFRMGVRCARTRVQGILQGLGGARCRIKDIARDEDVKPGDVFVSSGLDGVFPAGHLVGTVVQASGAAGEPFQWIELRPACDPARIERAVIQLDTADGAP